MSAVATYCQSSKCTHAHTHPFTHTHVCNIMDSAPLLPFIRANPSARVGAGCYAYLRLHLCLCTDRKMVATHLPLAWTHSSALEEQKLLSLLEDLAKTFQPH